MKFSEYPNSLVVLRKFTALLFFVFIMILQVKSQTNNIIVGKKYNAVKLCLNNYQFKKVKNLILTSDSTIVFENYLNRGHEVLAVNDVKFISERNGTYAMTYGLIGAGIGLFSVLITHSQNISSDSNWWAPMYIGFTAGGAIVGTLMGACIPKWKMLQLKDSQTSYSFKFSPNFNKDYYGLGLTVNFCHK